MRAAAIAGAAQLQMHLLEYFIVSPVDRLL